MILIFLINALLVTAAVLIHYEILHMLSKIIPKLQVKHRLRVVLGVFGTIWAHVAEIWLFGLAFYFLSSIGYFGHLEGNYSGTIMDSVYFSFTNYTTVGYGDIEPHGHLRFVAGIEAITGLSLITWSASFMFMEMSKFWEDED